MNSGPKFSTKPLPGDDWETRFTKTIVRNIARLKDERKLTTEALAARCNTFLKRPNDVKTSTLNGIFAGKRKSLSIAELQMFAQVLEVPLLALIYPRTESLHELAPDQNYSTFTAIKAAAGLERLPENSEYDFIADPRPVNDEEQSLRAVLSLEVAFDRLDDAYFDLMRAIEREESSDRIKSLAIQLRIPLLEYKFARDELEILDIDPGPLRRGYEWVWDTSWRTFDEAAALLLFPDFKAAMADLKTHFGWTSGEEDVPAP